MKYTLQKKLSYTFNIFCYLLLLLLNASGTMSWINKYNCEENAHWIVLPLIIICALSTIIFAVYTFNYSRKLYYTIKNS